MATPHINAQPGDFAQTVLMPGDPLRAKYIADNFLEDANKFVMYATCLVIQVPIKDIVFRLWATVWGSHHAASMYMNLLLSMV